MRSNLEASWIRHVVYAIVLYKREDLLVRIAHVCEWNECWLLCTH